MPIAVPTGPPRDVALLVARIGLAVVISAHTWQKLSQGLSDTAVTFAKFGIPLAIAAASFTIVVEMVTSASLVLGLRTPIPAAFMIFVMCGAIVFVHAKNGIFATNSGWEVVGLIIFGLLALVSTGPGRFSLDHVLAGAAARRETAAARRRGDVTVPTGGGDGDSDGADDDTARHRQVAPRA